MTHQYVAGHNNSHHHNVCGDVLHNDVEYIEGTLVGGEDESVAHEKSGTLLSSTYTFQLPPRMWYSMDLKLNTGRLINLRVTSPGVAVVPIVEDSGVNNKSYSWGRLYTGETGQVNVELLQNGSPMRAMKFAYDIFSNGQPGTAILAAEDATLPGDFNDAIIVLNWPLD